MDRVDVSRFAGKTKQELVQSFRTMTQTAVPKRDLNYFSIGRNFDLIFYVFETGPQRSLNIAENLREFPTLQRLGDRALVATKHYSTYPYTSDALFSIFSSTYPLFRSEFLKQEGTLNLPGMISVLANQGYMTATYAPTKARFEPDERMFEAFGIRKQVFSTAEGTAAKISRQIPAVLQVKVSDDLKVLNELKKDIAHSIDQKQRYVAVYLPGVGHGPWPDIGNYYDIAYRYRSYSTRTDGPGSGS